MDAIVEQALAKWPNVPHCYGWLALDARGNWRMRDEQAQQQDLSGDRIHAPMLRGFIERNYTHDEHGQWFFQNGPQRVYVNLEIAPFVARTDPEHGFVLQTGQAMTTLRTVWLSDTGRLFLEGEGVAPVAVLDDRDMAACLPSLMDAGTTVTEMHLMQWLESKGQDRTLHLAYQSPALSLQTLPVHFVDESNLEAQFHFVKQPRLRKNNS
ncbi:DUF2946 family protein [uncultured Oxalicibacterium sp.]|uniref:DUF2946 family protein n=1 Tax=uncultured Oxalicibacterium sp. TaxID=1168540 RepID=UPI0025F56E9E|nr:DUF2946 family protein [uncultured Oxalicibacterium sp.]